MDKNEDSDFINIYGINNSIDNGKKITNFNEIKKRKFINKM